jgi:hypothetical protein
MQVFGEISGYVAAFGVGRLLGSVAQEVERHAFLYILCSFTRNTTETNLP